MKTSKIQLLTLLLAAQLFFVGCKQQSTVDTASTEISTDSVTTDASFQETEAPRASSDREPESTDDGDVCFEKSDFALPYDRTLDPKKIKYKTLPCEVEGVEEFLCNNRGLRYVSLPKFKDVDVVLVPMDCGDFEYRYFLLTVVAKKVIANQYVEGEWMEPGDDSYKEFTKFTIDASYKITVTTNSSENGKTTLKEKKELQLLPDGKLKDLK